MDRRGARGRKRAPNLESPECIVGAVGIQSEGPCQLSRGSKMIDAGVEGAPAQILTGKDLGGRTLDPGIYHFATSAQLTGALTLDAHGADNAFWAFQIGSTLTTASASSVHIINAGTGDGLYWQVGSSATFGTSTTFEGNVLALTSITMNTSATIACGSALARNGSVTMDTNVVSTGCSGTGSSGSGDGGGST